MIAVAWYKEFLRFAVVGVISNGVLYAAYLVATAAGAAPKIAMSVLYCLGVAATFCFNKRWSFDFSGGNRGPFVRYCLSYVVGFVLNLLTLHILVDRLGYPHQLVQGLAVVEVAVILFLLHKLWVFRPADPECKSTS